MDYREGIKTLIKNYSFDVFLDIFRARSILSDLIGSNIYANHLMDLILDLYQEFSVHQIFVDNGIIKGRKVLAKIYGNYKDKYPKKEYIDALNPISEILYPKEYQSLQDNKKVVVKEQKRKRILIFKKILIDIIAKNLNILYGDKDYIEIINKTSGKNIDKYDIIKNELRLDINAGHDEIEIRLPKKKYERLIINGNDTNIFIEEEIEIKESVIKTNRGDVKVDIEGDSIYAKAISGSIDIKGKYSTINALTDNGSISSITHTINNMSVKEITKKGRIICFFYEGKVKPKQRRLFKTS